MDLNRPCGSVTPVNVQFINETEDIVKESTSGWDAVKCDSGDSNDSIEMTPDACGAGNGEKGGTSDGKRGPRPGKKTLGRVKIKMEYIKNKVRRYTTFSKRKTGIMKKAYELSALTGTQVMLLVASETGHVYTFATRKLQPMITSENGKVLIQTCLNSPDPLPLGHSASERPVSQLNNEDVSVPDATNVDVNSVTATAAAPVLSEVRQGSDTSPALNCAMKKETVPHQVPVTAHSHSALGNGQDVRLQSVLSQCVSKPALLPAHLIGSAEVNSSSNAVMLALPSVQSANGDEPVRQVIQLPAAAAAQVFKEDQTRTQQHLCYQLLGTSNFISLPAEHLKENGGLNVEQCPVTLLNVGLGNTSSSAGPAFVYPQGIVFASPANNLSNDGYLLSSPNASAFAVSSEGLQQTVSGSSQPFFTLPISAAQAQVFQSMIAPTASGSAFVDSAELKFVSTLHKKDIT